MKDTISKSDGSISRESQQRLLDTARGNCYDDKVEQPGQPRSTATHGTYEKDATKSKLMSKRRIMRSFPLTKDNLRSELETPEDFHATLCERIRNARERVYLATLYIGAGGNGKTKEDKFLSALSDCPAKDIRVLMDRNRGLRPIETRHDGATTSTTTDSAKACHEVLTDKTSAHVFLFQVLRPWQQWCLPNPVDEVFGVFHIKCYVIDNDIILTGANLSEEYFTDRTDRYLWLTSDDEDDDSLVECYADMVKALCRNAEQYKGQEPISRTSKRELLESLTSILTVDGTSTEDWDAFNKTAVVAYAVPTFQAPSKVFQGHSNPIPSDVSLVENLVKVANIEQKCHLRMASAYLNLTESFRSILSQSSFHALLTAGPLSHGFKPKTTKDGTNKGVPWIPTAYYTLLDQCNNTLSHSWFYQRPGWTFHAKGIWLSNPGTEHFQLNSRIRAVVHGSGNYGYRSSYRDMESNLILVMAPEKNIFEDRFRNEWNTYYDHCVPSIPRQPALPVWVKWALPYGRRFL